MSVIQPVLSNPFSSSPVNPSDRVSGVDRSKSDESQALVKRNKARVKKIRKECLTSTTAFKVSTFLETVRKTAKVAYDTFLSGVEWFSGPALKIGSGLNLTHLAEVVLFPIILFDLAKQLIGFRKKKGAVKCDTAVQMIRDIGALGRSGAIFTMGLALTGRITANGSSLKKVFFVASVILSLASLLQNYRTHSKMAAFAKRFADAGNCLKESIGTTPEDYQKAIAFIQEERLKDSGFIDLAFNIKEQSLNERLNQVELDAAKMIPEEGAKLRSQTLNCLKNHIHHVERSSRIEAIASLVSLAAAACLLFSPIAAVTYVVAGVGVILSLGNLAHHKFVEYTYAKNLGIERKWHEWITC